MSAVALSVESENLLAIAVVSSRAKADVFLHLKGEPNQLLHSDDLNPVASKRREAFIERVPEQYRTEAAPLLSELAELVAVQRAKARTEKTESEDPFPVLDPWKSTVNGAATRNATCSSFPRQRWRRAINRTLARPTRLRT